MERPTVGTSPAIEVPMVPAPRSHIHNPPATVAIAPLPSLPNTDVLSETTDLYGAPTNKELPKPVATVVEVSSETVKPVRLSELRHDFVDDLEESNIVRPRNLSFARSDYVEDTMGLHPRTLSKTLIETLTFLILLIFFVSSTVLGSANTFMPHSAAFAVLLLFLSAHMFGLIFKAMRMPTLLGMLVAGFFLRSLPGELLRGLETDSGADWSSSIRSVGLCVILLRSGLDMDIGLFRRSGKATVRLTLLPAITEAFTLCLLGWGLLKMPFWLALTQGFVVSSVSPAVVVTGMFNLQRHGYGVGKGIPSMVVAAASFDDMFALSCFVVASTIALTDSTNIAWLVLFGPLNVVVGVGAGLCLGALCCLTTLWSTPAKRALIVLLVGLFSKFGLHRFHWDGAGAMSTLSLGMATAAGWMKQWPDIRYGLTQVVPVHKRRDVIHSTDEQLSVVWDMIAQPLLFGIIGAALDVRRLKPSVIPYATLVVAVGLVLRLVVAYFAVSGTALTSRERVFVALSWMPKAAVQAALGPVPLELVRQNFTVDDPNYQQYIEWGEQILATAAIAIVLTAPVGALCINKLGPKWLERDAEVAKDVRMHEAIKAAHTTPRGHHRSREARQMDGRDLEANWSMPCVAEEESGDDDSHDNEQEGEENGSLIARGRRLASWLPPPVAIPPRLIVNTPLPYGGLPLSVPSKPSNERVLSRSSSQPPRTLTPVAAPGSRETKSFAKRMLRRRSSV